MCVRVQKMYVLEMMQHQSPMHDGQEKNFSLSISTCINLVTVCKGSKHMKYIYI